MKNLFEAATVEEVKQRISGLGPGNERQWGTMTASQALAHCSASMEWAVGDAFPPRMFIGSIIGRMIKGKVLGDDQPMRRNSPTAKTLVVKDDRDLASEQKRLCSLVDKFAAGGPNGCTTHPHTFFGRLTPDEWAILTYKHLDHHLRQFGA
jgi:Protein of unknown function (DUF1569)